MLRAGLTATGGAALGGFLSACDGRFGVDITSNHRAGTVELNLLLNHTSIEVTRFKKIIAEFERAHPHISVNTLNIANGTFYTKINTEGVAHNLPDVWYARGLDTTYDGHNGWLEPLDPYIKADPNSQFQDFWPALQTQISYQGKILSLPWNLSDLVVYVNKTKFEQAHLPIPGPDWDWAEFARVAGAFPREKKNGRQTQYGANVAMYDWTLRGILRGDGGELVSDDFTRTLADSTATIDTMRFFVDLVKSGAMISPSAITAGLDPFVTGQVAMSVDGSWWVAEYVPEIKDRFDWLILPLPRGKNGQRGVSVAGGGFGVSAFSAHKAEAYALAAHLTSPASLTSVVSNYLDSLPARRSAMPEFLTTASHLPHAPQGIDYLQQETAAALKVTYPPYEIQLSTAVANRISGMFDSGSAPSAMRALAQDIRLLIVAHHS
jgi:multiple sugar transport system substrate-binding protein